MTIGKVPKPRNFLMKTRFAVVLIGLFAAFGTLSLRIALNPKDRLVHRAPTTPAGIDVG